MAEQHEILLGQRCISYTLERKQVKRINMRIRPESGLSVSAPYHVPLQQIEAILQTYQRRILAALDQYETAAKTRRQQYPAQYVTGETVLYLGKWYQLEVAAARRDGVQIRDGTLLLLVCRPSDDIRRKQVFDNWWNASCEKAVRNLCRAVFPIYAAQNVAFPEIRFRRMVSQWGNCRPHQGILTFNYRLLAAPVRCMEYVVIHEFTHFLYPHHSAQFYQFIAREVPDWKQLQQQLQETVETRSPETGVETALPAAERKDGR